MADEDQDYTRTVASPPVDTTSASVLLRRAFSLSESTTPHERPLLGEGEKVGRYTVLNELSSGGMGVVYQAYDPQLDRNVALKLLRRSYDLDEEESSGKLLLREAQLLAQLQHPNVVDVYDSGLTSHGVFIAMELLRGQTLRTWLEAPRSVREIVDAFRAAGEGLAAAHDVGLVHRDFKAANVMMCDDGRVRLLDFGVARFEGLASDVARSPPGPPDDTRPSRVGDSPLAETEMTDANLVVGTPPYMAPEQVLGLEVDHRADQFSFCASLHWALYGHSPVAGRRLEERREHLEQGRSVDETLLLSGTTTGRVPARVRRTLLRGLARERHERFEDMHGLLHELREPPRKWPLVVGGAMLVVGVGVGTVLDTTPDPCASDGLESSWNASRREAVARAYEASGHPQASELQGRVEQQLDGYGAAWSQMYVESCRATFEQRSQSEQLYDRRLGCLERRRNRMEATIQALAEIEGPLQAVDRTSLPFLLPRIADCAELDSRITLQLLPEDPAQRQQVEELRRAIDAVETAKNARGDLTRGVKLAHEVVSNARAIRFVPAIAEALATLGSLQATVGQVSEAEATLLETIDTAAQVGDDLTAARAWTWLVFVLMLEGRFEEGKTLELAARAAVTRAGNEEVRGWLLNNLGALHAEAGDFERSLVLLRQALQVKQELFGDRHIDVGISWFNLGTAQLERQRFGEAEEALAEAQKVFEATVGPAHPYFHHVEKAQCELELEQGHPRAAIELCREVLERFEVVLPSAFTLGRTEFLMARALRGMDRLDEARLHGRRAEELLRADLPAEAREVELWLAELESLAPE